MKFKRLFVCLFVMFFSSTFFSLVFAQNGWQKYINNPVMEKDTTLAGTWEWAAIGQPSCIWENDTIKMYYATAGISGIGDTIIRGRISYAYSVDGQTWIKRNPPIPVLDVGAPGTWDSRWIDTPAILKDTVEFKLYYCGDSLDALHSAMGLATSQNGIDWQRYTNNPILEKGELLQWDGFWIESPTVVYDTVTNTYHMWYSGVGYGPGMPSDLWIQIGYATSPDGENWTKDTTNNPVLETGDPGSWDDGWVAVSAARKYFGQYDMWYCGVSIADWTADSTIDTVRIGYAGSPDGINWTKYAGNPVLSTYDPPVDSAGPWAPDVILLGGFEYNMWYETAKGICLATAPASVFEGSDKQKSLAQVFPNPFENIVHIIFHVSDKNNKDISLKIYDATGRLVKKFDRLAAKPVNHIKWSGDDNSGRPLPSGVYFIRFETFCHGETKKLVLER